MRDRRGKVLYVGKAASLRHRVRSYFRARAGDDREWIRLLPGLLGDIETLTTATEKEALLLENELIKKHRPPFNIKLRDDSQFLLLRLDPTRPFPRLEVTRRRRTDRARYFGPFHAAAKVRETLRLVNKHFRLRTCADRQLRGRTRPCLQGQMGRCPAPCVEHITPAAYATHVEEVLLLLAGHTDQLIPRLTRRMEQAAAALEFELAARLRDQIAAVRATLERQDVVSGDLTDRDVIGLHREHDRLTLFVLAVRGGAVAAGQPHHFTGQEFPTAELLGSFVAQYYGGGRPVPREVLLPRPLEEAAALAERLGDLAGRRVTLRVPQRGHGRRLLEMAEHNAEHAFQAETSGAAERAESLERLRARLRLTRLPRRVEAYDISHLGGELTVGSRVVFVDGLPEPAAYRHYRLRGVTGGDDYGALAEVLTRRLRRLAEEPAPDLLVIDGGKGQLGVVRRVLGALDPPPAIEVIALAKERRQAPEGDGAPDRPDRVYKPGVKDPIPIRPHTPELRLLQQLRDEAHRFVIAYSRSLHRKKHRRSALDDIPGIGPGRRRKLLRHFGSLKALRAASVDEIAAAPGIGPRLAAVIKQHLKS